MLRWKVNVRYNNFLKSRYQLSLKIITAVPVFRTAIQQIFALIDEISAIKLLPARLTDTNVYSIIAFRKDYQLLVISVVVF